MSRTLQLRIFLDSKFLDPKGSTRLCHYNDNDLFELVSIGESLQHKELQIIPDTSGMSSLVIEKVDGPHNSYKETTAFFHTEKDGEEIAKIIGLSYSELLPVFILEAFSEHEQLNILISDNPDLLSNRHHPLFPKIGDHKIFNSREGSMFVDLHCKKNGKYFVAPNFSFNKGLWYRTSMLSKVPYYQNVWSNTVYKQIQSRNSDRLESSMTALDDRITDMLMAVDHIGLSYYAGANNDTKDEIIYHFNYWSILFTGVLDSLAWISNDVLNLDFSNPMKLGLRGQQTNQKCNQEFITALRQKNSVLADLIETNQDLITLVHNPRNIIAHRERIAGVVAEDVQQKKQYSALKISPDFARAIQHLCVQKRGQRSVENGVEFFSDDFALLEPYAFVKIMTQLLLEFTNDYLSVFDLNPVVNKELEKKVNEFTSFHLGY